MNKIDVKPEIVAEIKRLLQRYSMEKIHIETGYSLHIIRRVKAGFYTDMGTVAKNNDNFSWLDYPDGVL